MDHGLGMQVQWSADLDPRYNNDGPFWNPSGANIYPKNEAAIGPYSLNVSMTNIQGTN